jgi:hypothetical protein
MILTIVDSVFYYYNYVKHVILTGEVPRHRWKDDIEVDLGDVG